MKHRPCSLLWLRVDLGFEGTLPAALFVSFGLPPTQIRVAFGRGRHGYSAGPALGSIAYKILR